jgi:hypothetical protein
MKSMNEEIASYTALLADIVLRFGAFDLKYSWRAGSLPYGWNFRGRDGVLRRIDLTDCDILQLAAMPERTQTEFLEAKFQRVTGLLGEIHV